MRRKVRVTHGVDGLWAHSDPAVPPVLRLLSKGRHWVLVVSRSKLPFALFSPTALGIAGLAAWQRRAHHPIYHPTDLN
jgi:hypothetical protein